MGKKEITGSYAIGVATMILIWWLADYSERVVLVALVLLYGALCIFVPDDPSRALRERSGGS